MTLKPKPKRKPKKANDDNKLVGALQSAVRGKVVKESRYVSRMDIQVGPSTTAPGSRLKKLKPKKED